MILLLLIVLAIFMSLMANQAFNRASLASTDILLTRRVILDGLRVEHSCLHCSGRFACDVVDVVLGLEC